MTIENDFRLQNESNELTDWANLAYYSAENKRFSAENNSGDRVVFMGDSITENWNTLYPEFFKENKFINRGIGGQTSPQMLIRFRQDVIDLNPKVVLILAGTNDIAGNTGPSTVKMIFDNIISMSEMALVNGVNVIICSVLPVIEYNWSPVPNPNQKIIRLNQMLSNYAEKNNMLYLDYYKATVDERPGLKKEYSEDEVHPNLAAYEMMSHLALDAIEKASNNL